jgi:hypothetical protein
MSWWEATQPADPKLPPALIPQVYLHYDPFTKRELKTMDGDELVRQWMAP